ncbi:MAG: peptide chain release factor 2 [Eubacteriales bacterium]|nr:peptide chain release factor 2 [Clostridiales bacterium]MDY3286182.1 peptide chain release factor 2 [Eubacteriales bacterium]MDY5015733.1 peptide chain release factor 2 [Eubacteriales bacterium]
MIQFDGFKQQLLAAKPVFAQLQAAFDLENGKKEIAELEEKSADPNFWNDLAASQKTLKRIKQLKDKQSSYDHLYRSWEDLMTLCEMAMEENDESLTEEVRTGLEAFLAKLEEVRMETLLSGEYDHNNAIMSFHAGAGGTEAQDWAEMLYRMYMHWAERHGFTFKVLDYLDGEEAGMKSAEVLVEGENAFGFLKSEMGIHRLVRVSPFDSSGRRHTSFAAVEVMPEMTDDDLKVDIREEDLKVDTYRSSGAGGQHVNKTESAVRITHIPTGIVVACQNERSQPQNRAIAMRMLKSKLLEIKEREHYDKIEDIKGEQKKIEWGSQIRSYVFMPYTLAKDHRTGFENGNINAVMDGDIDGFINAYLSALAAGTLGAPAQN